MPVQIRPDELIALLEGDFQKRYEPNFAWKSAASVLRALPGLRGAWTMGSVDENGDQFDMSGQGRTLSYNGNPQYDFSDLRPYIGLDGTGDYLSRADEAGLDILGTETYFSANARGLTMGGWFYFDRITNAEHLIGKTDGVVANASYWINFRGDLANDPIRLNVSDGVAITTVAHTPVTAIATGTWYYIVGRYDPGTELRVYLGNAGTLETSNNLVAIPAALNNGNASFTIGANSAGANLLDGRVSFTFLCAMTLSQVVITALWEQTRAMFGG